MTGSLLRSQALICEALAMQLGDRGREGPARKLLAEAEKLRAEARKMKELEK